MRYIIYGAGGIGSSMGGHLRRTGFESILIGRKGHVSRINDDGLRLITPQYSYCIRIPAVTSPREMEWNSGDILIMCMKSQDTEEGLRTLIAAGGDSRNLPIFCAQNSITNEPAASRYFERVYGVMVGFTGIYLKDGTVHNPVAGNAGYLEIGVYPTGMDDLAERVASDLQKASFAVYQNHDVMAAKGAKMLGNLGNALSAISDGRGDSERYLERVRAEGERCLSAARLALESRAGLVRRAKAKRGVTRIPEKMRNLGSSWQSLMRAQGSTEADYLNGEIVRLGKIHGIATPFNRVLQSVVGEMARTRELPGKYTAGELYQLAAELESKE